MAKRKIDHADSPFVDPSGPFSGAPKLTFRQPGDGFGCGYGSENTNALYTANLNGDVDIDMDAGSDPTMAYNSHLHTQIAIQTHPQQQMDRSRLTPVPLSPSRSAMLLDSPGSGRTRKRVRDNRPSEAEIYEYTMSKLYNAQRRLSPFPDLPPSIPSVNPLSRHDSAMSTSESPSNTSAPTYPQDGPVPFHSQTPALPVQRTNLHSFWKIERKPIAGGNDMDSAAGTTGGDPGHARASSASLQPSYPSETPHQNVTNTTLQFNHGSSFSSATPSSSPSSSSNPTTRGRSNTHPMLLQGSRPGPTGAALPHSHAYEHSHAHQHHLQLHDGSSGANGPVHGHGHGPGPALGHHRHAASASQGSSHGHFACDLCDRVIRPPNASPVGNGNSNNVNNNSNGPGWPAHDYRFEQCREEYMCRRCLRTACHLCAVVMAERRCLDCLRA